MTPVEPPPPFGFDHLPDKAHTSNGAHLARIKFYRNELAHSTDGKMSNTDFATLWCDLETAIRGLGGPSFQTEINDAKTIRLDNTLIDVLQNMKALSKQYTEISTVVDNNAACIEKQTKEVEELKIEIKSLNDNQRILELKHKIEQLEADIKMKSEISNNQEKNMEQLYEKMTKEFNIHDGNVADLDKRVTVIERKQDYVCDSHRLKIEEWEKNDNMFVKTKVIDDILEFLKHNHCLTVTGSPGIGKSASIHHVALIFRDTQDYRIIPCNNPSHIERFYENGRRQLFVFDDVCGKYSVVQSYVDKWKKHLEDIEHIFSLGEVKILSSCRIQVFMESQFQTLKVFTNHSFNLNSEKYLLQNDVKLQMAKKYLSQGNVDRIKDNLNRYEFIPLMFSLFHILHKKNKAIEAKDFFENPFEIYTKELDKLYEEKDKSKICALFLLVVRNNRLCRNLLTDNECKNDRHRRKDIFEECGVQRDTLRQCILEQLESLTNFIVKTNIEDVPVKQSFSTLHDKLFDFLCSYFGKRFQKTLIKYADISVLRDRTQLSSLGKNAKEFTIMIEESFEEDYFTRIIHEWSNGRLHDVFYNNQIHFKEYQERFLKNIKKLDGTFLKNLLETVTGSSAIAWKRGCRDIFKYLLNKQAEFQIEITKNDIDSGNADHYETPLTYACEIGDIQFAQSLVSKGATVNTYDSNGENCPLGLACLYGRHEIVQLLLANGADINLRYNDEESAILCYYTSSNKDARKFQGVLPVAQALDCGRIEIARLLIDAGADINEFSNLKTSLDRACKQNRLDVVQFLLDQGADVNKFYRGWGIRPIFTACRQSRTEIIKKLVAAGADIHAADDYDRSSLFHAIDGDRFENVIYLINEGVDINRVDMSGSTPLLYACDRLYAFNVIPSIKYQIVELLIQKGTDLNIADKYGNTPLMIAQRRRLYIIEQLLKETQKEGEESTDRDDNKTRDDTNRQSYDCVKEDTRSDEVALKYSASEGSMELSIDNTKRNDNTFCEYEIGERCQDKNMIKEDRKRKPGPNAPLDKQEGKKMCI